MILNRCKVNHALRRSGSSSSCLHPHRTHLVMRAPCITAWEPAAGRHRMEPCLAAKGKGFGVVQKGTKELAPELPCPCGSGATYEVCCSPFHSGKAYPDTPEKLLRSRYSAYHAKNPKWIADTTHPESEEWTGTRSTYISAVKATQRRMDCQSLEIVNIEEGRQPVENFITFKLSFIDRAAKDVKDHELKKRTERSRFLKAGGKWLYIDSPDLEDGK